MVTARGPRCSISTRKLSSDASVDYLKLTLINLPAALVVLGGVFSIDDLTGFEITKLVELPSPWGIVSRGGHASAVCSTSMCCLALAFSSRRAAL